MGLRDLKIHTTTISYRDQKITVRGISAGDVMMAAQDYGPQMLLAFNQVTQGATTKDTKQLIVELSNELPDLVAAAIALAADDYCPEAVGIAKKLPFNVQVEVVQAIFSETFYNEAEVKKLVESLSKMIAAASGALKEVTLPDSGTGTGLSDSK